MNGGRKPPVQQQIRLCGRPMPLRNPRRQAGCAQLLEMVCKRFAIVVSSGELKLGGFSSSEKQIHLTHRHRLQSRVRWENSPYQSPNLTLVRAAAQVNNGLSVPFAPSPATGTCTLLGILVCPSVE